LYSTYSIVPWIAAADVAMNLRGLNGTSGFSFSVQTGDEFAPPTGIFVSG
jgi:hypothetical protein